MRGPPEGDGPADIHVWGLSAYKRPIVQRFFPGDRLHFSVDVTRLHGGDTIALWGSAPVPAGAPADVRVLRLEDGFLRSVGLGADLVRPWSWVVDTHGIYYDARQPSDLERLLARGVSDAVVLTRAAALRRAVLAAGLTKYNVGSTAWARPAGRDRVILVPGQVESDASIAHGGGSVRTNMALLQAVRAEAPEAWIVYKPHPDVIAGLRGAGRGEDEAARWCDEVVVDGRMGAMLDAVDEVHVITSLAGFEALLRGKRVVTYGMPFYAGWGLTADRGMSADVARRRTRRVSLDEMVACALILYPRYASEDGRPMTPEAALAGLVAAQAGSRPAPWWRAMVRPLLAWGAKRRGTY